MIVMRRVKIEVNRPKIGDRIRVGRNKDDPGAYICSKCKTGMWEIRPSAYHYCPNCGAKMDEEKV